MPLKERFALDLSELIGQYEDQDMDFDGIAEALELEARRARDLTIPAPGQPDIKCKLTAG